MMDRCRCRSGSSISSSEAGGAASTFAEISRTFRSPSESCAAPYSGPPFLLAVTCSLSLMKISIGMWDARSSSLMTAIGDSASASETRSSIRPSS